LSCSATISQDLAKNGIRKLGHVKATTIIVTIVALLIALSGSKNVFGLVIFSWSGLASCFAALLVVYSLGGRPKQWIAISMMCVGIAVALLWRYLGWQLQVYEGMPGILAGFLVYLILAKTRLACLRFGSSDEPGECRNPGYKVRRL